MQTPTSEYQLRLDKGVFVVEFYARWCGTCRAITRHLTELEDEMGFVGVMIDVEQLPIVAKNFLVKGVPIVCVLADGIELGRIGGSYTKEEIRSWLLDFDVI